MGMLITLTCILQVSVLWEFFERWKLGIQFHFFIFDEDVEHKLYLLCSLFSVWCFLPFFCVNFFLFLLLIYYFAMDFKAFSQVLCRVFIHWNPSELMSEVKTTSDTLLRNLNLDSVGPGFHEVYWTLWIC